MHFVSCPYLVSTGHSSGFSYELNSQTVWRPDNIPERIQPNSDNISIFLKGRYNLFEVNRTRIAENSILSCSIRDVTFSEQPNKDSMG